MILELTDAQLAYQQEMAAFAAERLAPAAGAIDEDGRFPLALVKELAARGLLGVTIPTEMGGAGRDYVRYALAREAGARASGLLSAIRRVKSLLGATPHARLATAIYP